MKDFETMREEAREAIIETLKDDYSGYYSNLHNAVFNTDYYIIGTYEAEQELESQGVFDAIRKVQEYEKMNFGETYTDLSNPEKLINMLYYIIGEEVLAEMMDGVEAYNKNYDNIADEDTNTAILAEIESLNEQ